MLSDATEGEKHIIRDKDERIRPKILCGRKHEGPQTLTLSRCQTKRFIVHPCFSSGVTSNIKYPRRSTSVRCRSVSG